MFKVNQRDPGEIARKILWHRSNDFIENFQQRFTYCSIMHSKTLVAMSSIFQEME